jgi:hypothetical protein
MQWEYVVIRELPEDELNQLGGEGWEIITAGFGEEDALVDVLAKRSLGRGGGGRGRGGHGRGRGGPRIGVMGGTAIGDEPGY